MSETLTYSTEGISQLIIDTLASDATVRGVPGATALQINISPADRAATPELISEGRAIRFARAAAERVIMPEGLAVIVREALGDLRVQNLAGELSMEAVRGDLRLEALSGQVLIAQADADIRAEGVADLRILGAGRGDLRFSDGGSLSVESLTGDLRFSNVVEARLGHIHGDTWGEKVSGTLQLRRADGDVRLSDIGGRVTLATISGDLRADGLRGGLEASQINGDAVLTGPFAAASSYAITAAGDLHLHLPADADVRLTVRAAGRIRSDVPLNPTADGTPTYSATIGQGNCKIDLAGGGDLRIGKTGAEEVRGGWQNRRGPAGDPPFADLSNLGERIRQQVTASLASAGINIETGEFNLGRSGRFRGWGGPRGAQPPHPPPPPQPARPPKPTASQAGTTDEQIAILKMVEEGRITPEEADKLLNALGA